MYAKSPGETTAGTLSCLMPVFLDFLHGYEFQPQFADERLHFLPVLYGDVLKHALILLFLLPAHGALRLLVISTARGSDAALPVRQAEPPWPLVPGAPAPAAGSPP